jgi:hypothetical protein
MCCYTTFPSELSFRILRVSNFHDIELLMRIVVLDNANATDALAETIHQQWLLSHVYIPSTKKRGPYLEHLDEKENLGVFEIDGPSARNARDHGVDE